MHELWKFHSFYLRFLLNPSLSMLSGRMMINVPSLSRGLLPETVYQHVPWSHIRDPVTHGYDT